MVMPSDFVPLAEETGLIVPLGEWVIREACRQAASWPGDLSVAVNISPKQFQSPNLATVVLSALASSGLPAHRLELEITESIFISNVEKTLEALHSLPGAVIDNKDAPDASPIVRASRSPSDAPAPLIVRLNLPPAKP